jgi:hypothetical protein
MFLTFTVFKLRNRLIVIHEIYTNFEAMFDLFANNHLTNLY